MIDTERASIAADPAGYGSDRPLTPSSAPAARRLRPAVLALTIATVTVLVGLAGLTPAEVPAQQREAQMFLGGPAHLGVAEAEGLEELGRVEWSFATGGPVRSSPTLFGGTLHFGSVDGGLYAVDADTGELRWRFDAPAAIVSTPAVDADRVYFLDRRQSVYAVDRHDGALLWARPTGPDLPLPWGHEGWDYFTSSPTLIEDVVVVGSGDGKLYAIDRSTGEIRWRHSTGARIRSTPAVADGVVYVGDGAGIVHAVALEGGRPLWRFETVGHGLDSADFGFDRRQISSSPVLRDGVLYVGSRDARLYALDAATGAELWSADDDSTAWVIGSPAVTGERIFSARSSSRLVRALDRRTGEELWRWPGDREVFASPVLAGGHVHVADGAGIVAVLDSETGAERWRYAPGGPIWSTPLVHGDHLYVGTDDGSLYALARSTGPTPRLAVYHDEAMRDRSAFGRLEAHDPALAHFTGAGYRRLDAGGLESFLDARIVDGEPSVLVFAMDGLPDAVFDAGADSRLRRYLEAGGKAVWLSPYPPAIRRRDAEGAIIGLDRSRPSELLGVDLSGWNADSHPAIPTPAGRARGLEDAWLGATLAGADAVVEALARDDLGRLMAWSRSYGGPEGTGFVALYPSLAPDRLRQLRAVAEHGVLIAPR